jgi:dTDP-4-dehydrorhamnose reductase
MQRILIIGASSLVGTQLSLRFRGNHSVIGTFDKHRPYIDGISLIKLPLRMDVDWAALLRLIKPETIFYCAAERDEKLCREQPIHALAVNAEIPASIAACAESLGIKLVYFSSSKVFSGEKGDYEEHDSVDPISHYGTSKVRAEELLGNYPGVFVLRLGTVYGLGPVPSRSLYQQRRDQVLSGAPLALVNDEWRSFQSADWVAEASEKLLASDPKLAGIYHLPSATKETQHGFTTLLSLSLSIPPAHVQPVSGEVFSHTHQGGEPRGRDCSMRGSLFQKTFRIHPQSTAKYLKELASRLNGGRF